MFSWLDKEEHCRCTEERWRRGAEKKGNDWQGRRAKRPRREAQRQRRKRLEWLGGAGIEKTGKGMLLFIGPRDKEVWGFCGPDGVAEEGPRLLWGKLDVSQVCEVSSMA